ncbi:MAG: DMT family transporter [Clostridia bacterium]|nr:DMT family transporter [Clostridia bacterium]
MNKKELIKTVIVMLLWGSLFPFIKLGYSAFEIDTAYFPNLLLFAGARFLICGAAITAFCAVRVKSISVKSKIQWLRIISVGMFAVVLHYSFTYIGLTLADSSKTALLKQLGVLIFICFSFLFFKEDKFSIVKPAGAGLGLMGILVLNTDSLKFSFGLGEGLIIAASFCTVISNISCKKLTAELNPVAATGYTQLLGGIILTVIGLGCGGRIGTVTPYACAIFVYISAASIIGYCMWYSVVQKNNLSGLFIVKFLEPLFASLFGALLLGEKIFTIQHISAFLFVLGAILCVSVSGRIKQ